MSRVPTKPSLTIVILAVVIAAATLLPQSTAGADKSRAVSGWFGWWISAEDILREADQSNGVMGEASLFWWNWSSPSRPICSTAGGGCQSKSSTPWTNARTDAARQGLQNRGILVFATHTDLDPSKSGQLANFLKKPQNRQDLAEQFTDWAIKAKVDGIDLDWENMAFNDGADSWDDTRPLLNDMIARLGQELRQAGKLLSVTVPAGVSPFLADGSPRPGGGYTVFDWATLSTSVDRLRIMTYDYSFSSPGPIGPYNWAREVTRSAVAQVGSQQKSKLYVGLPQYGKSWFQKKGNRYVTFGKCNSKWQPTDPGSISLSPTAANRLAKDRGITPKLDKQSKEYTYTYKTKVSGSWKTSVGDSRSSSCTVRKEVWFSAKQAAAGRATIVEDFGIGGTAVWTYATMANGSFKKLAPLTKGKFRLKAKADSNKVEPKSTLTMTGTMKPKESGTKVKRQLKKNGSWRTKQKSKTAANGKVAFTFKAPKRGQEFKLRLVASETSRHGRIRSNVVKIKLR
ncbi:MAG: hypothetical protein K0U60_08700 [Actinomycetia bacterium]|nr:hypothetical protein [Actinomycetes bacterium]